MRRSVGGVPRRKSVVIPDEQRLMRHLLSDYDPASRPVFNASRTVVVKFGITLAQIADMVSEQPRLVILPGLCPDEPESCAIAKMTARCADKSKQTATPPPKIT